MEKYYHFTSYENLESINKYGLLPKKGGRTLSIGDNRCAVFLSQGIQNTILMYSSILYHYNSYIGDLGFRAIRYYKNKIKEYNNLSKSVLLNEDDKAEIIAMEKAIEWIKQIMSYETFFEYIGDGIYLSVSNISDINTSDPRDCYTTCNIPLENISVVLLKNKETGEVIDSREAILTYFMSITPIENIVDGIKNVITEKNIRDLYDDRLNEMKYYNKSYFELIEIPISLYFSTKEEFLMLNGEGCYIQNLVKIKLRKLNDTM